VVAVAIEGRTLTRREEWDSVGVARGEGMERLLGSWDQ